MEKKRKGRYDIEKSVREDKVSNSASLLRRRRPRRWCREVVGDEEAYRQSLREVVSEL